MKSLFLIVYLITLSALTASAQNIDTSLLKKMFLIKCIQLRDIPKNIGDTICVYGHVHNYKSLPDSNKLIINIDSASHGPTFTIELHYQEREAEPYLVAEIANNSIVAYGIIAGNKDNFRIVSYLIVPENEEKDMLAGFNLRLLAQKHRSDRHKTKIINVTLSAPDQ